MTDLFGKPAMREWSVPPLPPHLKRAEARKRLALKRSLALVARYGSGPEGARCGTCAHFRKFDYHDQRYAKCDLYGISHSEATDWRAKWAACGKYEVQG